MMRIDKDLERVRRFSASHKNAINTGRSSHDEFKSDVVNTAVMQPKSKTSEHVESVGVPVAVVSVHGLVLASTMASNPTSRKQLLFWYISLFCVAFGITTGLWHDGATGVQCGLNVHVKATSVFHHAAVVRPEQQLGYMDSRPDRQQAL